MLGHFCWSYLKINRGPVFKYSVYYSVHCAITDMLDVYGFL